MKPPILVIFVIYGYLIVTKAEGNKLSSGLKLKGEAAFIEVTRSTFCCVLGLCFFVAHTVLITISTRILTQCR